MGFQAPSFLFILALIFACPLSHSLPFVVFHGISDSCSSRAVKQFTQLLSEWSGSEGHCIEIGNGAWDSWFLPLEKQTEIACDKVKQMKELSGGFNLVGMSQGNLIGRGVIEFCEGAPPVKNYVSLSGPHAGIASVPLCGSGAFCVMADALIKSEIYSDYVQDHLAPSGYLKIPSNLDGYLEKCKFLPKLNNEIPEERNSTYKQRFSSLETLVLIMCDHDNVLVPRETSWFGYYPDGAFSPVLPPQKTKLYIEDWIGLRTLDEAGRVKYVSVPGSHLGISHDDMKKHIVPYLTSRGVRTNSLNLKAAREEEENRVRTWKVSNVQNPIMERSSLYNWPQPVVDFFNEMVGITEN